MLSRGIDRDKNNLRTIVKTGVLNLARSKCRYCILISYRSTSS